jgi:hypothetical protein
MDKSQLLREIGILKQDFPRLKALSEEYLFSLVCLKYYFRNGEFAYSDYKDCFVDGKNDGGIDLVEVNDVDHYSSTLSLIQGKFIETLANKQDIIDIFNKMIQTYRDFNIGKTARYNTKLKKIFREKLDFISDQDHIVELVLFISIEATPERKEEIRNLIDENSNFTDFIVSVYYLDDIINIIETINHPKRFVPEDKIKISKKDGTLKYGDNGILVNISALSLKNLYEKHKDYGLFEQNFRYFIRNKRIDDNIKETLKRKRDDFWYLNNGIIISCKDFRPDGDNVKLFDFSVVNGCQTTTLIGEYKGKNEAEDFYVPCKIIKSKTNNEDEFSRFMSEIAEASNSQKPISDRDLKSNRPEQRRLQSELKSEDPIIFVEIKRGEKQKKNLENWQKIKNDELGQFILSFNLQKPGTARSGKKLLFSSEKIYRSVFLRTHCKKNILDLLKLKEKYNDYVEYQLSNELFVDIEQESVARNGKFIVIAIIGFLLKYKRNLIEIKGFGKSEDWEYKIEEDDLNGQIFDSNYKADDFDMLLNSLFQMIIVEISNLYKSREIEEKTVSNFFKADQKYQYIIVKHFIESVLNNQYKMKETNEYLKIFDLTPTEKEQ